MAEKQTAGRDTLGDFAPKFAELNDDEWLEEVNDADYIQATNGETL